ncbi:hypothetical protein PUN28_008597 [Cardiocondyla obscurior]|uniref:Uncharacterized protein n=1 Tax=Cardiocondyla obscurior TaxID=286306 RepID=A0AAW2G168_9HYME
MTNYCFHALDSDSIGNAVSCSTLLNFRRETYFSAFTSLLAGIMYLKLTSRFRKFMGRAMRQSRSSEIPYFRLISHVSGSVIYRTISSAHAKAPKIIHP